MLNWPLFICVTSASQSLNPSKYSFLYLCNGTFLEIKIKRGQLNEIMHKTVFNTVPGIDGQCSKKS